MDVASLRASAAASADPTPAGKAETKTRTTKSFEETLMKVGGHAYWEVTSGPRKGGFVNASGNKRNGDLFDLVERDGRAWHVYGSGRDRVIVEVKPDKPATGGTEAKPAPAKKSA